MSDSDTSNGGEHNTSKSSNASNDEDRIEVADVLIELDDTLKGKLIDDFAAICDVSLAVSRETLIRHKWNIQVRS